MDEDNITNKALIFLIFIGGLIAIVYFTHKWFNDHTTYDFSEENNLLYDKLLKIC